MEAYLKEKKQRCQRNNLTEDEYDILVSSIHTVDESKFQTFIESLLRDHCHLSNRKIQETVKHMDMFRIAFTHPSVHTVKNYEYLEIKGDSILKSCILNFITDKFPKLKQPEGVQYISQMKNLLEKKESFFFLAEELNFFEYIVSDMYIRKYHKSKLLEDVFESFIGAMYEVLEPLYGYKYMKYCNNFVQSTFAKIKDIPTTMIELRGYITILKELVKDKHKGEIVCNWNKVPDASGNHSISLEVKIGSISIVKKGVSKTKTIGEMELSKSILDTLDKNYGLVHKEKGQCYDNLPSI